MVEPRSYHHGDLRAALLAAAQVKLARDGYEALSLRELARDMGVARSAPYAHFADRAALLWALVAEGARVLTERFEYAEALAGSGEERLAEACRSYLDFARDQPELFRLIFVAPLGGERASPPDAIASLAVFERLVGGAMRSSEVGAVRNAAMACWATLHGFAMLRLQGRLRADIDADSTARLIVLAATRQATTPPP